MCSPTPYCACLLINRMRLTATRIKYLLELLGELGHKMMECEPIMMKSELQQTSFDVPSDGVSTPLLYSKHM